MPMNSDVAGKGGPWAEEVERLLVEHEQRIGMHRDRLEQLETYAGQNRERIVALENAPHTPPDPDPAPDPQPDPQPAPAPSPAPGNVISPPANHRAGDRVVFKDIAEPFILDGWALEGSLLFENCADFEVRKCSIFDGREWAGILSINSKGRVSDTVITRPRGHGLELRQNSVAVTHRLKIIDPGEDGIQHANGIGLMYSQHYDPEIYLNINRLLPKIENCIDVKDGIIEVFGGVLECYVDDSGDKKHENVILHNTALGALFQGTTFIDRSISPGETKTFINSFLPNLDIRMEDCVFDMRYFDENGNLQPGRDKHWLAIERADSSGVRYERQHVLAGINEHGLKVSGARAAG